MLVKYAGGLKICFTHQPKTRWLTAAYFLSGLPETGHLTLATESARCPRSHVKRVEEQERAGVTRRRILETGRTEGGPLPRTQPGAGNERDPCRWSGTDAPAQRSESRGRYEQKGRESGEIRTGGDVSKVFDLDILFSQRSVERDECCCECVCVCFVCVFMFKMGHVHLRVRQVETFHGDEGTTSVVVVELTCKATFIRQWR